MLLDFFFTDQINKLPSFFDKSSPKTTPVALMSSVANMKIKQHTISKPTHTWDTNKESYQNIALI
jgi:hypothetical protein